MHPGSLTWVDDIWHPPGRVEWRHSSFVDLVPVVDDGADEGDHSQVKDPLDQAPHYVITVLPKL